MLGGKGEWSKLLVISPNDNIPEVFGVQYASEIALPVLSFMY